MNNVFVCFAVVFYNLDFCFLLFLLYFLSSKFCWSAHFVVMLFLCAASRWFSAFCCQIFRLLSHLLRDQRKDEEKEKEAAMKKVKKKVRKKNWRRPANWDYTMKEKPSNKVSDADIYYKPLPIKAKCKMILYRISFKVPPLFQLYTKMWTAINLSSRLKRQRFLWQWWW